MSTVSELHEKAMGFADQAFIARRQGKDDEANEFARKAFDLETAATELVKNDPTAEPTRSVLFRSAASLALECNEVREAERLIATALAGNPPSEIAEELRDLLEQAHFERHLRLQHVGLSSGELQLSIAGSAIGFGIALSEVFIERVKDMERLIYRTVERKLGREFRERGSAKKNIQEGYSLYIAAPRPGSFAVTLRLGRQMELPGLDLSSEVLDEILECFGLLNSGDVEELKGKIPQKSYYQNFVGLAKRIAPDGDKVTMVGLTKIRGDKEVRLALTKKQEEILKMPGNLLVESGASGKLVIVTGRLLLADARKTEGKIQLIEANGVAHSIVVPEGMMDDIVKPLWDEVVTVTGIQSKSRIQLKEISKAE